ncbi:MAG: endonuclease MutS2 [Anaerovoracaceae bacterium]
MNKKGLKVLEYNKIIDLLSSQAGSEMAKEKLKALTPSDNAAEIREGLAETTEAVSVIVRKGSLPVGQIYGIENAMHLARKGGSLTMRQLLQVLYNLKVASNVVTFLKSDLPPLPIINGMAEVIVTFPRLAERIDRCILSEDEMADSASPELRNIRRDIVRQNDAIRNRLNNILNSSTSRTYLQDAIVTMRDGRYVVPVKAENRAKVPGIVHDQSGSGATLFVEPQVIVELNNKLRELELAEKAEIERILAELSSNVAEHFHDIMNNQKLLIDLDVIFAKGKLSCMMQGEEPAIDEYGYLDLRQARHPLIDSKKVVPINVSIGKEYNTLVITGPNTGGKTVTLKTIGLLAMMCQSGLHIPAAGTSRMPVYNDIFADIGDEQSIEQSLSTFSSHMRNTVELVEKAETGTLVLLDELGAGTDPTEGAALAIAILERLAAQGAQTVATTHYNELKKYAISTPGVENASMEFDVETLSPTYRLSIGVPGKSNAFEISRKLGLPGGIIDRANELLEKGDIEFEDVLSAIEADKKRAEDERDEAEALAASMRKQQEELERRERILEKREREALQKAKEEARAIIREAKETASEVQKELRELSKVQSLGERNKRLEQGRRRLKETENRYQDGIVREVNENPVSIDDIRAGDKVKLLTLDQTGEVLTLPDEKGDLMVKVGIMKINVNVSDLMMINEKKSGKGGRSAGRYGNLYRAKAMAVSTSVNVVGKNLEDATMEVEKYLDDAYMAGLKEVTVIHGRGQGILKEGLRQLFKRNKLVASFRKGSYNEGGEGVTIVKLKE